MSNLSLINDDTLERRLQERFLTRRGFTVEEASTHATVIIIDSTHGSSLPPRDSNQLLLAIMPGNSERFMLKRYVGNEATTLAEADGKQLLLERCCDEVARAAQTIAAHQPSFVNRLLAMLFGD